MNGVLPRELCEDFGFFTPPGPARGPRRLLGTRSPDFPRTVSGDSSSGEEILDDGLIILGGV